jgi:hypothetical protein
MVTVHDTIKLVSSMLQLRAYHYPFRAKGFWRTNDASPFSTFTGVSAYHSPRSGLAFASLR